VGSTPRAWRVEQALQSGQRLRHARLRHADHRRGALHAAELGQLEQYLQLPELAAREQAVQQRGGIRQ